MDCPKCKGAFEKVVFEGIEVDRCLECQGLWFDMLEKEDLVNMQGSEVIDVGDEQVGREHNAQTRIDCPKCSAHMMPMIDKDQFHIQYECCPSCYGTFFDAGECRDLKQHTVVERFGQMLQTLRTNF